MGDEDECPPSVSHELPASPSSPDMEWMDDDEPPVAGARCSFEFKRTLSNLNTSNRLPNDVVLRLDAPVESTDSACATSKESLLHLSVVQQLMGDQLREIIRSELEHAFANHRGNEHLGMGASHHNIAMGKWNLAGVSTADPTASMGMNTEVVGDRTDSHVDVRLSMREHLETEMRSTIFQDGLNFGHRAVTTFAEAVAEILPCAAGCAFKAEDVLSQLGKLQSPPRSDCISRFADSCLFGTLCNLTIAINCVYMVYSADQSVATYKTGPSQLVTTIDNIFLALYTAEFLVKLVRHRLYYFIGSHWKFNWLDVVILAVSYGFLLFESSLPNVGWLRMMRIFKLAKALRVLHLIEIFKTCQAIIKSLSNSIHTFSWSVVLLVIFLFMYALIFVLRTADYLTEEAGDLDPKEEQRLTESFGSVFTAMLTLYMCMTGGNDWVVYYEALYPTGYFNSLFLVFFVAFSQMALLNIILGIFVDHAMKSLISERETLAKEHAEVEWQRQADLKALCQEADTSQNGRISYDEWHTVIIKGKMQSYLDLIGFRATDVMEYFQMLSESTEDGQVDIDTFLAGCMRLKGTASCFDLQKLHMELAVMKDSLEDQIKDLRYHLRSIGGRGNGHMGAIRRCSSGG